MVQLAHPYMTTGKSIALTRWTFVGKVMSLLFIFIYLFFVKIYLFMAMVGLIAVLALSLVVASRGYSLVATQGLLTTVAPLVVEQGLQAHSFTSCSMWALELRLSCSLACGIFPDQGLNWYPLHCKADS